MRRGNKPEILKNGQGKFVGFNLGADYCAEHEHGISQVKEAFGIEDLDFVGIERRRIRNIPNSFYLIKKDEHWTLVFKRAASMMNQWDDSELRFYERDELATAWSDRDFAIRVYAKATNAKKNQKSLEKLYGAMVEGEAAMWLGGGGVFQNAGFVIAIIDRCPKDGLKKMEEADLEYKRRLDAAEEIEKKVSLTKRLKEAGKGFFALSPKIYVPESPNWKEHTSFDIVYWLNPYDQQNNRYGYVTVEDLLQWARDSGPIVHNISGKRAGIEWHAQKGVYGKE